MTSKVIVDDRAGSKHSGSFNFVRHLKRDGVPCIVKRLQYGDFAFTGNGPSGVVRVGVERKTTDEIISAVMDNRFTGHQVPGLLSSYDFVILIVEGKSWPDAEGTLMQGRGYAGHTRTTHLWANYVKFQLTLMFKARLFIWPTRSKTETVQFIHALYDWFSKRWKDHHSVYTIDDTKPEQAILDRRTLKRRVAAQLPGVRWVRSKTIDDYFPSILDMINADQRSWQRALGVKEGRTLARNLYHTIREKDNSDAAATIRFLRNSPSLHPRPDRRHRSA